MAAEDRVRRRLLEGLVEDNLEAVEGRPKGSIRRARAARAARTRRWAAALTATAVAVTAAFAVAALRDHAPRPAASAAVEPAPEEPGLAARLASALAAGRAAPAPGAVIPLEIGTVVLDPGHGGVDTGTASSHGLAEKEVTLDIARRLAALLEDRGCRAVLTREEDRSLTLRERAEIANAQRADLFLSIHANWLPDRRARGFETYYLGPAQSAAAERLAAEENRSSGFALADYRALLEGLWAEARREESRRLATLVQETLVATLGSTDRGAVDRGVMTAPFVVLVATEMPAVLVEVACMSNDREAHLLGSAEYRQQLAEALLESLATYAASISGTPAKGAHG